MRWPLTRLLRRRSKDYAVDSALILPRRAHSRSLRARSVITFASVAAAVLAAAGTIWQARITQKSLELTRQQLSESKSQFDQQLRRSVEDSRKQDDITRQQLELTRKSVVASEALSTAAAMSARLASISVTQQHNAMRYDQRAWLGIGDARLAIDAKQLVVGFTVKNVGKSPATTVTGNVAWVGMPKDQKLQARDISYPRDPMKDGTIFPGQEFNLENRLPHPDPKYQAAFVELLTRGENTLYVFAKVEYKDIFNASHWTHYCVIVGNDLTRNAPCDIYNDSDSSVGTTKN